MTDATTPSAPGRSAVCGNRPNRAERSLIEDCAQVVIGLVDAVVPGATARDVGRKGEELLRTVGYFDDQATRVFPLLGHGFGASIPPFLIPLGDVEGGDRGWKSMNESIQPGMMPCVDAFLVRRR